MNAVARRTIAMTPQVAIQAQIQAVVLATPAQDLFLAQTPALILAMFPVLITNQNLNHAAQNVIVHHRAHVAPTTHTTQANLLNLDAKSTKITKDFLKLYFKMNNNPMNH